MDDIRSYNAQGRLVRLQASTGSSYSMSVSPYRTRMKEKVQSWKVSSDIVVAWPTSSSWDPLEPDEEILMSRLRQTLVTPA